MRPGEQQYLHAQHQQQQHQQQHGQHQTALQLNLAGFAPLQQQQHNGNPAAFLPPHYAQLAALNGLQVLGGMGSSLGGGGAMPGMQRGLLPMQQNGLLQHHWAQLRPESQAWGSGVFPVSQQGLIQANYAQQHIQQQHQVASRFSLQDLRSASGGLNGVPLPAAHSGDGLRRTQQWAHPHDVQGQYGGASMPQDLRRPQDGDLRRPQDGMRPADFSRNGAHGNGHLHGNGNAHNKAYDKNNRSSGNWPRAGSGGGVPSNNSRFKGGKNEKGRVEEPVRSQTGNLRCEACDRTFNNFQQYSAHRNTHIKCDVDGCSFEASGRVVKEHKQMIHESSPSDLQARSKSLKSKESDEETSRWIEERRKNYPTTANIKRKADETKARKLRGELVDEDARKRKERLKEILAKQAELGVPVAEVPAYYMSDRYGSLKGKGARGESSGPSENAKSGKRGSDRGHVSNGVAKEEHIERPAKVPRISDGSNVSDEPAFNACNLGAEMTKDTHGVVELKESLETDPFIKDVIPTGEKDQKLTGQTSEKLCFFYKRGRCNKGNRCEFLHERRPKKKKDDVSAQPLPKRGPTLLAKLLESDVRMEKSHLLQSFRFFVNNMFLLEFPEKPLKFFEWQEGNDRFSDAEVGRPDTDTKKMENEDGNGSDEDLRNTHGEEDDGEEDDGEISRLDGEDQEVQVESFLDMDGAARVADDWFDSDEDIDLFKDIFEPVHMSD